MSRRRALIRRLRSDRRGVALVEFALTAPLFLLILMGIFDFCWQMYAQQVLQGAVAKAGRDSTLELYSSDQSALDARVKEQVQQVFAGADVKFTRRAYDEFSKLNVPRRYYDTNKNGYLDAEDCFEDGGKAGNGGADDVILYTVTMRFDRVLPVWKMLGQSPYSTLSAVTILRNQPFANGSDITPDSCLK